jgi:hypothetical protein
VPVPKKERIDIKTSFKMLKIYYNRKALGEYYPAAGNFLYLHSIKNQDRI